jgi:hypothetical protein
MTKPILKLGFTDTFGAISNFFVNILSEDYTIIRDDVNPDYLIFGDKNFGNNNVHFNNKRCIKIFYTGENERPWNYDCHYAITFDHIDDDRHYRLPLYVIYDYDNQHRNVVNSKTVDRVPGDLNKKFKDYQTNPPSREKKKSMLQQFFIEINFFKTLQIINLLIIKLIHIKKNIQKK